MYVVDFHLPALTGDVVTVRPCIVFGAIWRAFTALAAQQRVIAESLSLTHITGRLDRLRRADTVPRHLVTQSAATLTCCRRERKGNTFGETYFKVYLRVRHTFTLKPEQEEGTIHLRLQ